MPAVMSWLVFGLACVLVAAGGALGGADPMDSRHGGVHGRGRTGAGGRDRPFPVEALAPVRDALPVVVVILAATSLACAAGLVVRTARAQGEQRTQLLWICLGAAAFVAGVFLPAVARLPAAGVPFILPCRPVSAWRCSATTCTGPGRGCAAC
ncbi:hypothetical protein [Microbispora sp. CA-102843]|uniref:hypothetical protein n=1 Tax=Microbispora sp. CA-102843 TaxID=3239952 RepID=UPI003D8A9EB1